MFDTGGGRPQERPPRGAAGRPAAETRRISRGIDTLRDDDEPATAASSRGCVTPSWFVDLVVVSFTGVRRVPRGDIDRTSPSFGMPAPTRPKDTEDDDPAVRDRFRRYAGDAGRDDEFDIPFCWYCCYCCCCIISAATDVLMTTLAFDRSKLPTSEP